MSERLQVQPFDEHNQQLVQNVHPPHWVNPEPDERYNMVVLGAGTAGLITALGSVGLGARVALIEREFLGGDCLNVGCVPSKALLRAARTFAEVRDALEYGIEGTAEARVNFSRVMERMRRLRASISPNDSAERYRSLGVDVYFGQARFTGPDTVDVEGRTLRFRRAVIATGARAARPVIPGLTEAGYYTNETIFTLTELPPRLVVLGAGPIGCELSQAFARFGSEVTLLASHDGIMPREDPDAARLVEQELHRDGVNVIRKAKLTHVGQEGMEKILHVEQDGEARVLRADAVLVGVGRMPNVQGLGLETAGVAYDDKEGVKVNDRLQTTNPSIFAAGDICSQFKFTHAADAMARLAIQNALFLGRARVSALTIPWCTYTDPEIAHVGLYEDQARAQGIEVDTFLQELRHVDRAILDGETNGFVKVHVRKGSDRILGATIVARHAGEMLSEITLAMTAGLGLSALAKTIHPYPTQAEAIKRVSDAYNRTRLTPLLKKVFGWWFAWMR